MIDFVSYAKLKESVEDVNRLEEIHEELTGNDRGRRFGVDILNRSQIVLTCASWEAFVEDVATEAAATLTKRIKDPSKIPEPVRRSCMERLVKQNDLGKTWQLISEDWKKALSRNVEALTKGNHGALNTPKSFNVDQLLLSSVGIPKLSDSWSWKKMSANNARKTLDEFVALRGDIAHRLHPEKPVSLAACRKFRSFVERLGGKSAEAVSNFIERL
jgi:hypothetical protein